MFAFLPPVVWLATAEGGSGNGLSALLPLLCRHAGDVVGELRTKQVAAALLALLGQRGHPALVKLSVASDEVEAAPGEGRRTRSQARQAGGLRYKQVGGQGGLSGRGVTC
jgi:hypothetical protein